MAIKIIAETKAEFEKLEAFCSKLGIMVGAIDTVEFGFAGSIKVAYKMQHGEFINIPVPVTTNVSVKVGDVLTVYSTNLLVVVPNNKLQIRLVMIEPIITEEKQSEPTEGS